MGKRAINTVMAVVMALPIGAGALGSTLSQAKAETTGNNKQAFAGTAVTTNVDRTKLQAAVDAAKKAGVKVTQQANKKLEVPKRDEASAIKQIQDSYTAQITKLNAAKAAQDKKNSEYAADEKEYQAKLAQYKKDYADWQAADEKFKTDDAAWKVAHDKYVKDKAQYDKDYAAWQTKEAEYKKLKAQYDKDLAAYQDEQAKLQANGQNPNGVDPSGVIQKLLLHSEPDAKLSVKNNNTSKLTGRTMSKSDIPKVNGKPVNHSNGGYAVWQKSGNGGVSGPVATATYTNIKNSSYNGKKISKIVYTFSNLGGTNYNAGSDTPELDILQDPTEFVWYVASEGITFKANYYGSDGKLINFAGDDSYVSAGSLNAWYVNSRHKAVKKGTKGVVEAVKAVNNNAIAKTLQGSSVKKHAGNELYANENNNYVDASVNFVPKGYEQWDTPNSKHSIYGAGLFSFKGTNPTMRFHAMRDDKTYASALGTSIWATFSSTLPSAVIHKPTAPKEPAKPVAPTDPGKEPVEPKKPTPPTRPSEPMAEVGSYQFTDLTVDTVKAYRNKYIEKTN